MTKFVGLRAKTYSYLVNDGSEDKKARGTKKYVIERKLKFENHKNCLEATELENKINHLEKNKINIDGLKKIYIIHKSNKSILKTQQKFKSEMHITFTEELIKIALGSNDDKRMQSNDLIEIYARETSKVLVSEKEMIKCKNYNKKIQKND